MLWTAQWLIFRSCRRGCRGENARKDCNPQLWPEVLQHSTASSWGGQVTPLLPHMNQQSWQSMSRSELSHSDSIFKAHVHYACFLWRAPRSSTVPCTYTFTHLTLLKARGDFERLPVTLLSWISVAERNLQWLQNVMNALKEKKPNENQKPKT